MTFDYGVRYLPASQFVSYCSDLNVKTDLKELEHYEEIGVMLPRVRIVYPEDYVRIHALWPFSQENEPIDLGQWPELLRLFDKHRVLPEDYADLQDEELIDSFDREMGQNPYLFLPKPGAFTPWDYYAVRVPYKDEYPLIRSAAEHYYGYWQVHQLHFIQRFPDLYKNKLLLEYVPEETKHRIFRPWAPDPELLREFKGMASMFDALSFWISMYHGENKRTFALIPEKHRTKHLDSFQFQLYRERLVAHATHIQTKYALSVVGMYEFLSHLLELYADYRSNERQKLLDELRNDILHVARFIALWSGIDGNEIADKLGERYGIWIKQDFRHLDIQVRERDEAHDLLAHHTRRYGEVLAELGITNPSHVISTSDIDSLLDYCERDGLAILLTALSGMTASQDEYAVKFRRVSQYTNLKNVLTALEYLLKDFASKGRLVNTRPTMSGVIKRMMKNETWFSLFEECEKEGFTQAKNLDEAFRNLDHLLSCEKLKQSEDTCWARVFLVASLARNLTVHNYPNDDRFFGELFGEMLQAAIYAVLYSWQKVNEDGYELWLRYRAVDDAQRLGQYRRAIKTATLLGAGATAEIIRHELARALPTLLDGAVLFVDKPVGNALVVGTIDDLHAMGVSISPDDARNLGEEGFLLRTHPVGSDTWTLVTGNSSSAVLTGAFHFLRLMQTHQDIRALDLASRPRIRHRILTHWDNLDGTIERGYAGRSLWNWDELPQKSDPRYHDYARACASIGINGTCLNNVNANAKMLTSEYLQKVAALADLFRPYGLRVYLSIAFSAPMQLGGLNTSDPRDPGVAEWWQRKVDEIYRLIPDFGGLQVKANSEGQPGPQDYGANHDDGANMLAAALEPHGGILLWRAFVYDTTVDADRSKCGYKEFAPLDGKFQPNVLVQVKNGPIDFQPREPFHPLFGAMRKTPLALELQITQEYLGQSKHLVYLGGMWKEILDSDTFVRGPGSTVAQVVDGSLDGHALSCIIGVANTGSERNWCGHHFAQANWYCFGRFAWDHALSAETIADEWTRMTWSNEPRILDSIKTMVLGSWQACIDYMTPLGLHHLMQEHHHYGPDPGFSAAPRVDWSNVYFHRADRQGLGYDRGRTGSDAVSQYHSPLREQFDSIDTCPDKFLLWFHHAPWDQCLASGRTLWEELQWHYDAGVAFVEKMQAVWQNLRGSVDPLRHAHVSERLEQQLENAREWRQVCVEYFGRFAGN